MRRGLSLAELMISIAIMAMLSGVLATMALGVQSANEYTRGQSTAAQHARVVLQRIDRTLQNATFSESFPGFAVVSWTEGSESFPDTLVVWKPSGTAVDPSGVPRANELVIYRPDPTTPSQLLEITNPYELPTVTYAANNTSSWRTLVTTLVGRSNAQKVVLTDLMRTALGSSTRRGVVRFRSVSAPTETEISNYRAASANWSSLNWPLDRYGMRNQTCYTELQLVPDNDASDGALVLPFFWSTSLSKTVTK